VTGIFPTNLPPILPSTVDFLGHAHEYFRDGREGKDRWGRERRTLWACGTGWGEDEYVCPAYVEEACPGNKGKDMRMAYDETTKCELLCGKCGGGDRAETIAYCGFEKGQPLFNDVVKEFGGSLRADRWNCTPSTDIGPWGTTFMPSVEWGAKAWIPTLNDRYAAQVQQEGGEPATYYPWLATTYRTASPGKTRDGQRLRERLGGFPGKILVHGLVKDDVLDDFYDDRKRLFRWLVNEKPDIVVTPQFSYYSDLQNCMFTYNTNRIFQWFCECRELGMTVGLDWPPGSFEWQRQEYNSFVERNEVKLIVISYQTLGSRGLEGYAYELQRIHQDLPPDVSFLLMGIGQVTSFLQAGLSLPGRNLCFAGSDAFARAAFFRLVGGDLAPKRYTKADTFAHNVMHYRKITNKVAKAATKKADKIAAREANAAAKIRA